MHRGAQRSGAFAMDNSNLRQAEFAAFVEISGDQFAEISRTKRVQIQLSRNWQQNGCVVWFARRAHGGVVGGGLGVTPDSGSGTAGVAGGRVGSGMADAAGKEALAGTTVLDLSWRAFRIVS